MDIITLFAFFEISCLSLFGLTSGQRVPRVSIVPSERSVAKLEGENYLVSCKSNDNMPTQWQNPRNEKVGTSELQRIRTEASIGLELYLNDIKMKDAGIYTCISRSGRAGFNLTVVRPIVFNTSYAVQSAQEGRDFVMKCVATAHAANPRIIWRIRDRGGEPKPPHGRFRQLPDGSLRISRVTEADGRHKYICRAMDVNPSRPDSKDMAITLKVQTKPKLQGPRRKNMYGVANEWANLTCSVSAEPPARFEWYMGNKRLWTSNDILIFNRSENVSILQLLIRRGQDFGDYVCKAINKLGNVNQTLTLKRAKKPGKPILSILHLGSTGVAVRAVNPSEPDPPRYNDPGSASDKRMRPEELPVIGYTVQYKLLKRENWVTAHNATRTNYGFILRNLVPNVTYFIRASARNAAASGNFSAELKVITPKNVPFNPPLNGVTTPKLLAERSILTIAFIVLLAVQL